MLLADTENSPLKAIGESCRIFSWKLVIGLGVGDQLQILQLGEVGLGVEKWLIRLNDCSKGRVALKKVVLIRGDGYRHSWCKSSHFASQTTFALCLLGWPAVNSEAIFHRTSCSLPVSHVSNESGVCWGVHR